MRVAVSCRAVRGRHHNEDRLVWRVGLATCWPIRMTEAGRAHCVVDALRLNRPTAALLGRTVAELRALAPMAAAALVRQTLRMRRRSTMYLTYYRPGDTATAAGRCWRSATAYRDTPASSRRVPKAPDYPAVVLEFAATVEPRGRTSALIEAPCADRRVTRGALADIRSPYVRYTVKRPTLPSATNQEVRRAENA